MMRRHGRNIAMWSAPRNISTAMMRAWENRADTQVVDEPFYAHYLDVTGIDHPMASDVIAAGETDWRTIVETLTTRPEHGIFYQKHIATHWLPHFDQDTDWLDAIDHVFLIREPEPVVASYSVKRDSVTAADLGYTQLLALFERLSERHGEAPPVIDSGRFLLDPKNQLRMLCERLDMVFDEAMLRWPSGARESDGIWGRHWYNTVNESTSFTAPRPREAITLSAEQQAVVQACRPCYETLAPHALPQK